MRCLSGCMPRWSTTRATMIELTQRTGCSERIEGLAVKLAVLAELHRRAVAQLTVHVGGEP